MPFLISLFQRAFLVMKNRIYFILLGCQVTGIQNFDLYVNYTTCDGTKI